jgi:hypothetical protein
MDTVRKDLYTFTIISRWFRPKVRNVSDKEYREHQNTCFMFSDFLYETLSIYEIMWKNMVAADRIKLKINSGGPPPPPNKFASRTTKQGYRHTLIIFNTHCFSCSGAVGWDTALQAGRSRVRFPMLWLEFITDIILLAAVWNWGWLSL